MIKAVIFDKDGVLMDTEKTYFKAYRDTISYFGGNRVYGWNDHKRFMGMLSSERFLKLKNMFNLSIGFDDFINEYRKRYFELFEKNSVALPDGLKEFLHKLKSASIKLGVATSSSRKNTDFTLKKTNLTQYFDVVVTADDVSKGKPHPELFQLAASKLHIAPGECVVIGDSINDMIAAKAAGMKVIMLVNQNNSAEESFREADFKISGFNDVRLDSFLGVSLES